MKSHYNLKTHFKNFHGPNAKKRLKSEKNEIKCDKCSRTFQRKDSLKRHTMAYHPENAVAFHDIKCPLCNKIELSKEMLENHLEMDHPIAKDFILVPSKLKGICLK